MGSPLPRWGAGSEGRAAPSALKSATRKKTQPPRLAGEPEGTGTARLALGTVPTPSPGF